MKWIEPSNHRVIRRSGHRVICGMPLPAADLVAWCVHLGKADVAAFRALWGCYASYDDIMRTVGTAAAIGLATGVFSGVVGYFVVRLLVERFGIIGGPPAGVLLVTFPSALAAIFGFIAFLLALLQSRKAAAKKSTPSQ